MAIKGVAITISYKAYDTSADAYKTGDVGNHSLRVMTDGTDTVADNAPAEVDATNRPGDYKVLVSVAEMGGNVISVFGKSSTANIILIFAGDIITEQGTIAVIDAETDKIALADAGAGVAGSLIEEIENIDQAAMRGTDNAALDSTVAKDATVALDATVAKEATIGVAGVGLSDVGGLSTAGINAIRDAILPKKNTALSDIEFLMVDSADHITPKTGLTVTGTMSIDAAAFVAVNGAIAEVADGIYQFDASADDMNGTIITFRFISAGADDTFLTLKTGG